MNDCELLFCVTSDDCEWQYTVSSTGVGTSDIYCEHGPSKALGSSKPTASLQECRLTAFTKMSRTKEFKQWYQREIWSRLGILQMIERVIADGVNPENLRMEVRLNGKWIEVPLDSPLYVDRENISVTLRTQ